MRSCICCVYVHVHMGTVSGQFVLHQGSLLQGGSIPLSFPSDLRFSLNTEVEHRLSSSIVYTCPGIRPIQGFRIRLVRESNFERSPDRPQLCYTIASRSNGCWIPFPPGATRKIIVKPTPKSAPHAKLNRQIFDSRVSGYLSSRRVARESNLETNPR